MVQLTAQNLLQNRWSLKRTITDELSELPAFMAGQASFEPTPNSETYRYSENGVITVGDYKGPFDKTYLVKLVDVYRLDFYFDEERFFHTLNLKEPGIPVTHKCNQDSYQAVYTFDLPIQWAVTWNIKGPNKNLKIRTTYEPFFTS
jgi:hypothetical protein